MVWIYQVTLELTPFDMIGIFGVICVLWAYLWIQLGRWSQKDFMFSLVNFIGSVALIISLLHTVNLASLMIEIAWLLISILGIFYWIQQNYLLRSTTPMTENLEDLSVEYEEEGITTVKQLDKVILSKGAWSTIIYRYQEWNPKEQTFGKDKYTIRRYQKIHGEYQQKSKFNLSSADQAQKLINALHRFLEK